MKSVLLSAVLAFAISTGTVSTGADHAVMATGQSERAQVYIVEDPLTTVAFRPRQELVRSMVDKAITNLTGKAVPAEAWLSLVSTQDLIGIKVYSQPGPNSGTRRAVVTAVVEGLLSAGLEPAQVIIWDKHSRDLRRAGYYELGEMLGVRVAGSADAGYDESMFYESALIGNLIWGDSEFGKKVEGVGRKSFVSELVSRQITRIINITPLMNHNHAGVTGNLFSLALGSVDNTARFEGDASRLAIAVPELCALPVLADRVALNIVDALICQYEGEERSLLHHSTVLNQLRFSRDPVALDVLSLDELQRQRERTDAPRPSSNSALYENAALLELGVSDRKRIQVLEIP